MKLSLTQEELQILINELQNCESVTFSTEYESKLTGFIVKEFLQAMMMKYMKCKPKHKIILNHGQLLALNYVLPQIKDAPKDDYSEMIASEIYHKINRACLSIS